MANKNILLVEPGYRNKYPPLGLMKIAQYHGSQGKRDNVRFVKGEDPTVYDTAWDRVYITTLFSFEWVRTARSIDYALDLVGGQAHRVFVGGIAASLMNDKFIDEPRWRGVRFIKDCWAKLPPFRFNSTRLMKSFMLTMIPAHLLRIWCRIIAFWIISPMNIPSLMPTSPMLQGDACANALSAEFRRWKACSVTPTL